MRKVNGRYESSFRFTFFFFQNIKIRNFKRQKKNPENVTLRKLAVCPEFHKRLENADMHFLRDKEHCNYIRYKVSKQTYT